MKALGERISDDLDCEIVGTDCGLYEPNFAFEIETEDPGTLNRFTNSVIEDYGLAEEVLFYFD